MTDDDLIRRGDALRVADEVFDQCENVNGDDRGAFAAAEVGARIAAIPTRGVGVPSDLVPFLKTADQASRPQLVNLCREILAALAPTDAPDLSDPVTVHVNMLRGTIAKPTVEQIVHLYGREAFQPMIDVAIAKALEKACLAVSEHADWPEDEHGRTEQVGLFVRVINAILAITPALSSAPTDAATQKGGDAHDRRLRSHEASPGVTAGADAAQAQGELERILATDLAHDQ